MILLVLASVLAAASADCGACVDGRCYSRTTLARGLHIPDQMAIDRKNGILYVPSDSTMNTAFYHEDLTIQLIPKRGFVGLAVDQDTQVLYTAEGKNILKYLKDNNYTTEIAFPDATNLYYDINLLFHKDCLTYTQKQKNGLHLISRSNMHAQSYNKLVDYTISDFIVKRGCDEDNIYFVANDTVYQYIEIPQKVAISVNVVAFKNYVLSIDKDDNVYFGDASVKVIYKMDEATNKLVAFAAYEAGAVDKFVFDDNNNIVSYDSADGSFSHWKASNDDDTCSIEVPSKYRIIKKSHDQF